MYHHQDQNQIVFTTITVSVSRQEEEEEVARFCGVMIGVRTQGFPIHGGTKGF